MASSADITKWVIDFANQTNSGFTSPGIKVDDAKNVAITPALATLASFAAFELSLSAFMDGKGVKFLGVSDELKKAITWDDLATQIALNQK